jgi:hypothetical protein
VGFFLQWLELDGLDRLEKDRELYPAFGPELRDAMRADTRRFVDYVFFATPARLSTFLTARYAFPSGPLEPVYGIDEGSLRVGDRAWPPEGTRAGLLTQPAFLAVHAGAEHTSPVRRGKWIREHLLCQSLPPPPPGVDTSFPEVGPDATTRERFEQHSADPSCATCHALMDDLGFALEHYDAVGAWRDQENGHAIDASGALGGTDVDGEFEDALSLSARLSESGQVRDCVTRQWFRYALGRVETDEDAGTIERSRNRLAGLDGGVRELVEALAASEAMRCRSEPAAGEAP